MSELSCKNLSVGYDSKVILENLNFEINSGSYLCILGENGSGKTTLMKTMLGLIKPVSGEIRFSDGLKQNEIGYLPQQNIIQNDFPASAFEIVVSGCQGRCGMRPFYSKDEKNLALENMKCLNILELKNKCYSELSGGQQQRVLLARALCATRRLLLLDEPVSSLDPKVTLEMYEIINKINRKDNITIIMISHDIASAIKYATHILYIGSEIFFGTRDEYINSNIAKRFVNTEDEND